MDQLKALVESPPETRTLVLAGPGTGKTEAVAQRLGWLICASPSLRPSSVLVLSFSRSAVQVLVQRLLAHRQADADALEELRFLSVRTFDSWCFRMLRNSGCDPVQLLSRGHEQNIEELLGLLQRKPDFVMSLGLDKVKHLIVDECQDLTGPRAALVLEMLRVTCPSTKSGACGFTILGDPDQAIYDWTMQAATGRNLSSIQLITWIEKEYRGQLQVPTLEKNHRADRAMLDMVRSAASILHGRLTADQKLESMRGLLATQRATELTRTSLHHYKGQGSVGVLCRTNGEALLLSEVLREHEGESSIIDVRAGTPPSLLPAWIAKVLGRFEGATLTRTLFARLAGLARASLGINWDEQRHWKLLVQAHRLHEDSTSLQMTELRRCLNWPDCLPDDEWSDSDGSSITTIHQSKGREYDRIIVAEYQGARTEGIDQEQESRLLYVGLTRARNAFATVPVAGEPLYLKPIKDKVGKTMRQRWMRFSQGHTFLEVGIEGDVDSSSFVSSAVFSSSETAEAAQRFLADKSAQLIGCPVELEMTFEESSKKVFYEIILLVDGQKLKVGRTTPQLTFDILAIKHKDLKFPMKISGLRLSEVVSHAWSGEPPPTTLGVWRKSGIWLGVGFHGLGTMRMNWKKKKI